MRRAIAVTSLLLALGGLTLVDPAAAAPGTPGTPAPAAAAPGATIFPVPTSSAGLGRIVTSPDGSMWFVERDANKVGRITPTGQITEFAFPAQFPGTTTLKDLDVAPDGTVWVIYESGRRVRHMDANGATLVDGEIGPYPYGEQVRVGPDGTAWITMSYDEDYVIRIVGNQIYDNPNAPGCNDSLGEAADGSMWCRQGDGLIHINADASGGVRYPAGSYAAYPYAIAAGPVGSIWFGRYFSGTMFTSPDDGEVGYLDAASSATKVFNTGSRTAPADLVQGPDGNMWFTSIGAAAGIGHVSPQGRGALTAIGGYEPVSLTFAKDGAIFATDPTNNVILRVTRDQLQTTNVDPGKGSVFQSQARLGKLKGGTAVLRQGAVPLTISCPKDVGEGCAGRARLTTNATKRPRALSGKVGYKIKAGKKGTLRVKLNGKGLAAVPKRGAVKLRLELFVKGEKDPVAVQVVKVRR